MAKTHWFARQYYLGMSRTLYFWPLIAAGGRMVMRIVLNLWNMVEPGGADLDQTIST